MHDVRVRDHDVEWRDVDAAKPMHLDEGRQKHSQLQNQSLMSLRRRGRHQQVPVDELIPAVLRQVQVILVGESNRGGTGHGLHYRRRRLESTRLVNPFAFLHPGLPLMVQDEHCNADVNCVAVLCGCPAHKLALSNTARRQLRNGRGE